MPLPFIDGLNRVLRGVVPMNNAGGLLDPQETQDAQRQGLLGMGAGLLGAAGPNRLPVSFGQALSAAALQSNQMQNSAIDQQMKRKLLAAESVQRMMALQGRPHDTLGVVDPNKYEPASIAEFARTGDYNVLKPRANQIGRYNPGDYTTESWAQFSKTGDPDALVRLAKMQYQPTAGGGIVQLNPLDQNAPPKTVISDTAATEAAQKKAAATSQATQLSEVGTKRLDSQYGEAQAAQASLGVIGNAKQLLDEGIRTGTAASQRNTFARALDTILGRETDQDALSANTDAYIANAGQLVGQVIKAFGSGTGLSNADREYAQQIAGGNVTITESAIRRILDIQERAQKNLIRRYNSQYDRMVGKYSDVADFYDRIPEESPYPPVTGAGASTRASTKTPTRNAKGWVLHQDAAGNKAYVSPDGKQYEAVP